MSTAGLCEKSPFILHSINHEKEKRGKRKSQKNPRTCERCVNDTKSLEREEGEGLKVTPVVFSRK